MRQKRLGAAFSCGGRSTSMAGGARRRSRALRVGGGTRRLAASLATLLLAPAICLGCAHAAKPREKWGSQVELIPTSQRLLRALKNAVTDPFVYVPAVAAGVTQIDHWDRKISDWAADENPIFGSEKTANDASDIMLYVLRGQAGVTFFLTSSGKPLSREWFLNKLQGGLVEAAAYAATQRTTGLLKSVSGRERPDGYDDRSFPSGHTSESFMLMTLANRNLEAVEIDGRLRTAWQVGNSLTAAATGWARVEGRQHYPADVLAGAALGRFLTVFIHDAWLLPDGSFSLDVEAGRDRTAVTVSWRF